MKLTGHYNIVILCLYCFSNFSIGLLTVTLSCINTTIQSVFYIKIYSVDVFFIELCTTIFFINYFIFLLPGYYFEERFGMRKTLLLGLTVMSIGAVLRLGAISSFWWILAGSLISSLSQPFILNIITKISAVWFIEENRIVSTSLSMISFLIGQASSYVISAQMVPMGGSKLDVFLLMLVECIICVSSLLASAFFFKNNTEISDTRRLLQKSIKEELMALSKSVNFVCLFMSSIISQGTGNYFIVVIEIVGHEHGFDPKEVSYFGSISIASGILSCVLCSFITLYTHKFKLVCVVSSGLTVLAYIGIYFAFSVKSFTLAAIASVIYGACLMPVYTIPLELACEITYPIRENLTSGLINCIGTIFAVVPVVIVYLFNNDAYVCMEIAIFFQVISFLFIIVTKEELRRRDEESLKDEKSNLTIN